MIDFRVYLVFFFLGMHESFGFLLSSGALFNFLVRRANGGEVASWAARWEIIRSSWANAERNHLFSWKRKAVALELEYKLSLFRIAPRVWTFWWMPAHCQQTKRNEIIYFAFSVAAFVYRMTEPVQSVPSENHFRLHAIIETERWMRRSHSRVGLFTS